MATRSQRLAQIHLRREWPWQLGIECANCQRTGYEALRDQENLKASERLTVREENGRVAIIVVCDMCLMPLGYQVEAETADPAAPTLAQRGFKRWQEWRP